MTPVKGQAALAANLNEMADELKRRDNLLNKDTKGKILRVEDKIEVLDIRCQVLDKRMERMEERLEKAVGSLNKCTARFCQLIESANDSMEQLRVVFTAFDPEKLKTIKDIVTVLYKR